ncbi:hypothetical protein ACFOGJ_30235 [Marinibaculum pumilum]|uniref:Secreted protein n=1 Tax=Marinibaculum pumilum TaxID=1766165 RepID=A0ABV7LAC8_9PROT
MQERTEGWRRPATGPGMVRCLPGRSGAAALVGGALLLAAAAGAASAADMAPITSVDDNSPKAVSYQCEGMKHRVDLELRADTAEDFYIQAAGPEVMIPVTCATATQGLSASGATISCNKQVKGNEPMSAVDGRDLADALAMAVGSSGCRRVK